MKISTKTELFCRRCAHPEVTLQEVLDNHIEKYVLPKGIKENLLNELKELFLPYWLATTKNIVNRASYGYHGYVLKTICHWSEEANSGRAVSAAKSISWKNSKPSVPR